jgi:hypothetical protein
MSRQNTPPKRPCQTLFCQHCDKQYRTWNYPSRYCSRSCKSVATSHPLDVEKAVELYQSGHSVVEVAELLGSTFKVVQKRLSRAGCKMRPRVKRNQSGEHNSSWTGAAACYSALHARVYKARGKPSVCEGCGTTESSRFEWANLTGDYADINDYKRLCAKCHKSFDRERREATGKSTSFHIPRKSRKEGHHAS